MINNILKYKQMIHIILAQSLVIKFIILYLLGAKPFLDGLAYATIAQRIFNNNFLFPNDVLIDAPVTLYFYALFYPLYDSLGMNAFAIGNIFLATATIYILFKITMEVFENIKIANLVSLIVLLYPFLNFYSIAVLTETVYIFFLYLSFLFAIKFLKTFQLKFIVLFTLFFTIDTLTRFANLGMYPFFLVLFIFVAYKNKQNFIFISKIIALNIMTFILVMSFWWVRNYIVYDKFILTSTGYSGHVFYSGNNPINKSGGGISGVDVDFSQFEHIKDVQLKDKAQWDAGIKWIKENPKDWLMLEFRKFKRFFSLKFYTSTYDTWYYNLASILSYGIVLIFFVYGIIFRMKKYYYFISPMLMYSVLLVGIHMLFIASIRYRLPIEPFMIIVASDSIYILLKTIKLIHKND